MELFKKIITEETAYRYRSDIYSLKIVQVYVDKQNRIDTILLKIQEILKQIRQISGYWLSRRLFLAPGEFTNTGI